MVEKRHCSEVQEDLDPWLDGELEGERERRLRHHLEGCPDCRRELELARSVVRELRSLPEFDAPASALQPALAAGARRAEGRKGTGILDRWLPLPRPAVALAAVSLVLLVGLLVLWEGAREPKATPESVALATARQEAAVALSYVHRLTRRAGVTVRQEVLRGGLVGPTAQELDRSLGWLRDDPGLEGPRSSNGPVLRRL